MPAEMYKKQIQQIEMPEEFTRETAATVGRIDENHHVIGVMYLKNNLIQMSTCPEVMSQVLNAKLPVINRAMRHALAEIDVLDELVAYRIETKNVEIMVAPTEEGTACVVHRMIKKRKRVHK